VKEHGGLVGESESACIILELHVLFVGSRSVLGNVVIEEHGTSAVSRCLACLDPVAARICAVTEWQGIVDAALLGVVVKTVSFTSESLLASEFA